MNMNPSSEKNIASERLVELTADIIGAYVANNSLPAADIPSLISSIHQSLTQIVNGSAAKPDEPVDLKPAVSPKKSVHEDYIICLEDGKKFKSLKRHLRSSYGMTPEQYRAKWGLPSDYPMVAPGYSKKRSDLARDMGLGKIRAAA